jgi:hypothetical protein
MKPEGFKVIPEYTKSHTPLYQTRRPSARLHTGYTRFGRIFCGFAAKNRAFRSKSSDLPMQILWAFRYNAPEDGRFPRSMDCSGRYRAPGIPCAIGSSEPSHGIATGNSVDA